MTYRHGLPTPLPVRLLCALLGLSTACVVDDAIVGLDIDRDARDATAAPRDGGSSAPDARDAGKDAATGGDRDGAAPLGDADVVVVYGFDAAELDAGTLDGSCLPDSLDCPFDDGVLGPCDPRTFCTRITVQSQPAFCNALCWQDENGLCVNQCPPSPLCTAGDDSACAPNEHCYLPPGSCELAQPSGYCAALPLRCPNERDVVCGCDGVTYDNPCQAQRAGASIASYGPCP